ncbi:uncharacterized protein LOC144715432 isoform X4 [Wolffia australiana]
MDEGKRGDLSGPSNVEGPSAHASLGESGENLLGSNSGLADDNEQVDNGPGIYAIPVPSFAGEWTGIPATNLIPIKYNVPTVISSAGGDNGDTRQEGEQQQQQQQGQVVRRFHFAIQIDLMLIFKLAAVVILFNQEGSRQRLVLLILFASIIYLYQTGAFTPLLRWLRQAVGAGAPLMQPPAPLPEENEHNEMGEGRRENGVDWGGIVREIKVLVISFLASLFPGFHVHND